MNINDVKTIAAQLESKTLEFKKSLAGLEAAGRTLSAFLNQPEAGMVLIGVANDGKIVGQQYTDSVSKKIAGFLNRFQPAGRVEVTYVDVDSSDKKVIVLRAGPLAHERPYSFDGTYYERVESTTQQLTHEHIGYLYSEARDLAKTWGEKTSNRYKIEDLDLEEVRKAIKRGVDVKRIESQALDEDIEIVLHRMELLENGLLTNAAVVLFAKNVRQFLPQCRIHLGRFRGTDKYGEILDSKIFYGNAFQILKEAENFVGKHHFVSSHFVEDSFERVDTPTLPVFAVREALVNAICHRSYCDRSSAIYLEIYDDKMEVWNSGLLPPGWDLKRLQSVHKSAPRNELIANTFFLRKYVERWGMGVQKIFDECKKAGLPRPKYCQYSDGVAITFPYKEPLTLIVPETQDKKSVASKRRERILEILRVSVMPMSLKAIVAAMPKKFSERLIRNDLYVLKERAKVNSFGRGPSAVWYVEK